MAVPESLEEGKIYRDYDGTLLVAKKSKTCYGCYFSTIIAGPSLCHRPNCDDYIYKKIKSILIKKKERK